jgi:hypothetical protein
MRVLFWLGHETTFGRADAVPVAELGTHAVPVAKLVTAKVLVPTTAWICGTKSLSGSKQKVGLLQL